MYTSVAQYSLQLDLSTYNYEVHTQAVAGPACLVLVYWGTKKLTAGLGNGDIRLRVDRMVGC